MISQKEIMQTFLSLVAAGKVQEGFDSYVHTKFIHHNQYFPGDRQSLLDAMRTAHHEHPNRSFTIMQTIEEADRVVCYSKVEKEYMDIVVVHIARFIDDKIIELRDTGTIIDPESPNKHGLF